MTRIEEVEAERVVLQAQVNSCDNKIEILKQIEKLTFADISSTTVNFNNGTSISLQLEEKDELKDAILKILEERVENE